MVNLYRATLKYSVFPELFVIFKQMQAKPTEVVY